MKQGYKWHYFRAARQKYVVLTCGDDLRHLKELDKTFWAALAVPTTGIRFDARTLAFLDTDKDGRIRAPELLAGVDWALKHVTIADELFNFSEADEKALQDVMAAEADLDNAAPSPEDIAAEDAWRALGDANPTYHPLGENTAAAEKALSAIEPVLDDYFQVPEDLPLVTEEADKALPLACNLNPKWAAGIASFVEKVLKPLNPQEVPANLTRAQWEKVKTLFAPYRAWCQAKPIPSAQAKAELFETEKKLRFKKYLLPLLRNYVNMADFYAEGCESIFRTGTFYIDAKACNLCFHVEDESAHAALAAQSGCFLVYFKLTRKATGETRNGCAVVTAGNVKALYVGRNGIFIDRDGLDWDAVITKVLQEPVSLREAFFAPWCKLFETVSTAAKKFLSSKQDAASTRVAKTLNHETKPDGAALASSVAALGVGVGMAGAACAGLIGLVAGLPLWKVAVGLGVVICSVSVPNMILTFLKLRRRDLGAILNASGWAVNKKLGIHKP